MGENVTSRVEQRNPQLSIVATAAHPRSTFPIPGHRICSCLLCFCSAADPGFASRRHCEPARCTGCRRDSWRKECCLVHGSSPFGHLSASHSHRRNAGGVFLISGSPLELTRRRTTRKG